MKMKYYGYGGMSKKSLKKKKAGGDNSAFAKLAPPYDKATYADKIAGATKGKPMAKFGMQTGKPALESSMNGVMMKHGGSCGKVYRKGYFRTKK